MNCHDPSKRMRFTSKYGYIIEQPSIIPNTISHLIQHDANHIPNVLNIQAQNSNILYSVPDNATMFQRSHASIATINNTSYGILNSVHEPPFSQSENEEEDNYSSTSFSPYESNETFLGEGCIDESGTAGTMSATLNRFTTSEYTGIKLWNILDKRNAPKGLYDEICSFIRSTNTKDLMYMPSSSSLVKDVIQRTQNAHKTYFPDRASLSLPSNNTCAITVFDFKNQLFTLLNNNELMDPNNLLLDLNNTPNAIDCSDNNQTILGDVNNSQWFIETTNRMCTEENDILVPVIFFIDETTVAHNGSCSIEPVSFTLGIFNRETRGNPDAWSILGYIPSMDSNTLNDTDVSRKGQSRLKDYHAALKFILHSFRETQNKEKLIWNFYGKEYNLKIPIMFIIGDTKGHDKLVGRYTNYVNSKSLVRDCRCLRSDGDVLNQNCRLITANEIKELIRLERIESLRPSHERNNSYAEELKNISFHKDIDNAWNGLDFGANEFGINGACPPCLLHVFHLRFPDDIVNAFLNLLGTSDVTVGKEKLNESLQHILHFSCRQSTNGEVPDMSTFKYTINPKTQLTAEKKYARLFTLYVYSLTQVGDNLIKENMVCKKDNSNTPSMAKVNGIVSSYKLLMERTLTIYQWLYQDEHKKTQMQRIRESSIETLAHHQINQYLGLYKSVLSDEYGGNPNHRFNFAKFHLMQHFPMYISRFGSPKNFDGGASERNHKSLTKQHARRTQMRTGLLSIQTAKSLSMQRIMKSAMNSQTDTPNCQSSNGTKSNTIEHCSPQGSKFQIIFSMEDNGQKRCQLIYDKNNIQPTQPYDNDLLSTIANELWGKGIVQVTETVIPGFTELRYHDLLFRAHPSYRRLGAWFDFARFKWDDSEDIEYPGRILMFLDLREIKFNYGVNFSNELYAVIQSTKEVDQVSKNRLGKNLKICRYWKMELKYRIVSVECISGASFVLNNFNQMIKSNPGDEMKMLERVIEIKPLQSWREIHE